MCEFGCPDYLAPASFAEVLRGYAKYHAAVVAEDVPLRYPPGRNAAALR
jgi:hypothetical protein